MGTGQVSVRARARRISAIVGWIVLPACLAPVPAFAYIDPGSGGMLLQMLSPIVAMIIGALMFVRERIKTVMRSAVRNTIRIFAR